MKELVRAEREKLIQCLIAIMKYCLVLSYNISRISKTSEQFHNLKSSYAKLQNDGDLIFFNFHLQTSKCANKNGKHVDVCSCTTPVIRYRGSKLLHCQRQLSRN